MASSITAQTAYRPRWSRVRSAPSRRQADLPQNPARVTPRSARGPARRSWGEGAAPAPPAARPGPAERAPPGAPRRTCGPHRHPAGAEPSGRRRLRGEGGGAAGKPQQAEAEAEPSGRAGRAGRRHVPERRRERAGGPASASPGRDRLLRRRRRRREDAVPPLRHTVAAWRRAGSRGRAGGPGGCRGKGRRGLRGARAAAPWVERSGEAPARRRGGERGGTGACGLRPLKRQRCRARALRQEPLGAPRGGSLGRGILLGVLTGASFSCKRRWGTRKSRVSIWRSCLGVVL